MEENSDFDNNPAEGFEQTPSSETEGLQDIPFQLEYEEERSLIDQLKEECAKFIIGQDAMIEKMLICIISDGHILLEGPPGLAKTITARVLARAIDADFNRIQFTPDLMPADIIGTAIFNMKASEFEFKKGPIFSNIILIDEINRAPAKTQAALFEVMEERQVSYDSMHYNMDYPFLIIATQNPIEQEGTYRLPEAQLDRFLMKIIIEYPDFKTEVAILDRYKSQVGKMNFDDIRPVLNSQNILKLRQAAADVTAEDQMLQYIASIVQETRNNAKLYLGASPRASLGILRAAKVAALMEGRNYIIPEDVQFVATPILCHRIILSPESEIMGERAETIIEDILQIVEVPR